MSDLQTGSRSSAARLRTSHAQSAATLLALAFGFTLALGCSPNTSGLGTLDGGSPGAGGAAQSGGRSGAGGSVATGGASGTGGRLGTGGATSTGGTPAGTGGVSPGSGGAPSSGGSGAGGRVGTGGAGTGGRVGTGGAGTGGAATGGAGGGSEPECKTAADCHLVSDCCNCLALPAGATITAPCALTCIQSKCAAQQVTADAVACVAGRCVAGFTCDTSKVTCKVATPNCMPGEVPGVNAEGTCYSGGCVPVTQCKSITNCNACSGDNTTCVRYSADRAGGDLFHCVTIPTACHGSATCDCMGKSTCIAPVSSCGDQSGQKGLVCSCPTC